MGKKSKKAYNKWDNDKKRDNGYKLIQLLKDNPEKFQYAYQLLEEYNYYGLELSSLIDLLHNENDRIRSVAIDICYELNSSYWDELLDDVIPLLKDKNVHIIKYALKIVATYPDKQNCMIPFNYLEHNEQEIRLVAMKLFDSYSSFTLKFILDNISGSVEKLYQECVSLLLSADEIDESEINRLINSDNEIKRKFAIIIACKYPKKYFNVLQQDFKDDDIKHYVNNKMN